MATTTTGDVEGQLELVSPFVLTVFYYQWRGTAPNASDRGYVPCDYLESPEDIHRSSPSRPARVVVRERGGSKDNHVHWVDVALLTTVKGATTSGPSTPHGVIERANWVNHFRDPIWIRSDLPLMEPRESVPAFNLKQMVAVEVWIGDVRWLRDKRPRAGHEFDDEGNERFPIIFAGPKLSFAHHDLDGCPIWEDHRMVVLPYRPPEGNEVEPRERGKLKLLSGTEIETAYENYPSTRRRRQPPPSPGRIMLVVSRPRQ